MAQSARGGMMETATTHRSLKDLEHSLMLTGDPAAPNAESVSPPPEENGADSARSVPAVTRRKTRDPGSVIEATTIDAFFDAAAPARTRLEVLHTRIPDWLNEALERRVKSLEEQNSVITKQAIVTFALIKALGVTPPEGFRLV